MKLNLIMQNTALRSVLQASAVTHSTHTIAIQFLAVAVNSAAFVAQAAGILKGIIIQSVWLGLLLLAVAEDSAQQAAAETFPATAITSKESTSAFATTKNAFYASDPTLAGQCTWYAYGRVIELAEQGYLDSSAATLMETAFWGKSGRDARNWPTFLGGEWTSTGNAPLPMEERRPGMLVVWIPADTANPGHVGFVEEVSADQTQYRVSDFNRHLDETYDDTWFKFEDKSGWLKETAPTFYQLLLPVAEAEMTTPTPGSTLSGSTVTFAWSAGQGVSQYFLYLGNSQGANDLYGQSQGASRSVTMSGIPTDGRKIYVRIWSYIGTAWQYNDTTYTAASGGGNTAAEAEMTTPTPGSTLSGSTVTFAWSAGQGVSQYFLYLGNSQGANDLYGQSQGASRSVTMSGIPTDGRKIYVRIWSYVSAAWQYSDATYTAAAGDTTAAEAEMTAPAPGSTLTGSTVTFAWSAGQGVSQYFLYLGNSQGANDLYGQTQGANRTVTISGIPTDGRKICVRIWSYIGAAWQHSDATYTAASGGSTTAAKAEMTAPTPGSALSGSTVTFAWSAGQGVSQYFLYLGNSQGANDLYGQSQGASRSVTLSGVPTDGRKIYVRIWSYISAAWQYSDTTYAAKR